MIDDEDYALREDLRKSEAERERLEREMAAMNRLDAKVDDLTVAVKDLKRRLAEYDAMCLSARMHDQVFLTAGEVKTLSELYGVQIPNLEERLVGLADRVEALGRRMEVEVVDAAHMDGAPYDCRPTLVGRVRSVESFLTELNGRVAVLEDHLADDGR